MAKKSRKVQQHLRQAPARKRTYQMGGSSPREIYKPGFPMNLMGDIKVFSIVGIVVAAIMVVTMIWFRGNNPSRTVDTPTLTPTASVAADNSATPSATPQKSFQKADQVIDASKNAYTATMKTDKGDIVIKLYADQAPNTVNSFVFLAKNGYFDGQLWYRAAKGFVIQTGSPSGSTSGNGPGYVTQDEPNQIKNTRGTLAMAKRPGVGSFLDQFFINLQDNTSLDYNNTAGDKFYPFGEVTSGMDIADTIGNAATDSQQRPLQPVKILSVTIDEKAK